jgi:hypothetical protein
VPAAVVRDHPKALFQEEHHLTVPIVSAQWPAVMKEKRLAGAPILVEDLSAVCRSEIAMPDSFRFVQWNNILSCPVGSMASSLRGKPVK